MALTNCPECQRKVSDQAPTCPGCGYPIAAQAAKKVPQRPAVEPTAPPLPRTPTAPPAAPSPAEPTAPEKLREMLLGDLTNVSLRKRYLAARTPTLKEFDRFSAPKNPSFVEDVGRWVLCAVLGPPMLAAVLFVGGYLKSNGFHNPNSNLPPPSPGQVGELFGHFLFLGILVGLLLGLATLCIGGIVFLWKRARCGQLRNRWEELGPLPAGAPPDATEARKRFLGEA